jgi:N-acetylmuramoyl-L-alanine amidase
VPQRVSGRVVIDPGHGGKDPGAQIPGVDEKAVNLSVARLVAKKLSDRGVTVSMTRKSDVFIELADRAAAGRGEDLFVSIHADSHPSPEKVGHSLLLPQSGDPQALLAGRYIDQQMTAAGSPSHIMRLDTRGLMVLKRSECPAVLVELGYLSNFSEAKKLATAGYQEQLAEGIADGIVAYLGKRK